MTLPEFIVELGDQRAAELFGVKLRTVQSWRLGERFPRPKQAGEIVRRSKGRVDYEGIFSPRQPAASSADEAMPQAKAA